MCNKIDRMFHRDRYTYLFAHVVDTCAKKNIDQVFSFRDVNEVLTHPSQLGKMQKKNWIIQVQRHHTDGYTNTPTQYEFVSTAKRRVQKFIDDKEWFDAEWH